MRFRLDPGELDRAARAPQRQSIAPNLKRRRWLACRFGEVLATQTPEELEELERQRNEDAAREPIADTLEGAA